MTRQQLFCKLKAPGGLVEDEAFGLFLEIKGKERLREMEAAITPPFDINKIVRWWFGVSSCADISTEDLAKFIKQYEEYRYGVETK